MKLIQFGLTFALVLGLVSGAARAQDDHDHDHDHSSHAGQMHLDQATRSEPWSSEALEAFATLPVQDGGRVKPLDSIAGLRLLTLNGKRKLKLEDGEKLNHDAWLLDVLFFPGQAIDYPCFRVENDAVLTLVGVEAKKKRDWYSYNDLIESRSKLFSEAQRFAGIEAAEQSEVQRQTLKLATDVDTFESLLGALDFARFPFSTGGSPALRAMYGEAPAGKLSEVLAKAAELRSLTESTTPAQEEDFNASRALFGELERVMGSSSRGPALFPPVAGADDEDAWLTVSGVIASAFTPDTDISDQLEMIAMLERLEELKTDPAAFTAELQNLNTYVREIAEIRGEYGRIPLEVKMYSWDLFTNSLVLFILAFLLSAFGWMFPKLRLLSWGAWGTTIIAVSLVVTGITLRCIIRQRPPVVSLYDTILFTTGCGVLVTMMMELMTRRRVALALGTLFGVAGMFLAGKYELKEISSSGDTMASVVAVLDTNYYLAIHVTTITMGYVGGLVACLFAHVWILGKIMGLGRRDPDFYKSLSRMIYGLQCFCLFFALFGTIMGGVWANDSWGRFWGWDPKENGALLICLWVLMALHARLGGYVRDRGMAVLAVLTGVVVSASWWGVNLLNVGLHSYGFTSGIAQTLYIFWGIEGVVILVSFIDWMAKRNAAASQDGGDSGAAPGASASLEGGA